MPEKNYELTQEIPVELEQASKGMIRLYLTRKGFSYAEAQHKNYDFWSPSQAKDSKPQLRALTPPKFLDSINQEKFSFYRKSIRSGYIYIYSREDDFWLAFEQCGQDNDVKYRCMYYKDTSDTKLLKKYKKEEKKKKEEKEEYTIELPYSDKNKYYYIAFSEHIWSPGFINDFVKKNIGSMTYFHGLNLERWEKKKKGESVNPSEDDERYSTIDEMYELRDKANEESLKNYANIDNLNKYSVQEYVDKEWKSTKGIKKSNHVFFTIDDINGVVEDIAIELYRFVNFKEKFVESVNKARSMDSTTEDLQLMKLLESANILYPMLYSDHGLLNQPEFRANKENGDPHKYQSLVQEFKFNKILAIDERKKYQNDYDEIRNILGDIMCSKEYENPMKDYLSSMDDNQKMRAQQDITTHYNILKIKSNIFDGAITKSSSKDKWENLLIQMSLAYFNLDESVVNPDRLKEEGSKLKKDSSILLVLSSNIDLKEVLEAQQEEKKWLNRKVIQAAESVSEIGTWADNVEKAASFLSILLTVLNPEYQNLMETQKQIQLQLTQKYRIRANIIAERKVQLADVLRKYTVIDPNMSPDLIDKILKEDQATIDQVKAAMKRPSARNVEKFERAIDSVTNFNKNQIDTAGISDLEISNLHLNNQLDDVGKNMRRLEKVQSILGWINLSFSVLNYTAESMKNNRKSAAHTASLLLSGVALTTNLATTIWSPETMSKGIKSKILKLAVKKLNVVVEFISFAAELFRAYDLLNSRNPEAAKFTVIAAFCGLVAGIAIIVATSVVSVPIIVISLCIAGISFIAGYFMGERAAGKTFDQWQGFLVNSIFSNYKSSDRDFRNKINALLNENNVEIKEGTYYEIAQLLDINKEKMAVDNHFFRGRYYNLQDFVKMRSLIDELETAFQVNLDTKPNFSDETNGNYILPNDLTIKITFLSGRFTELEHHGEIHLFVPTGSKDRMKAVPIYPLSPKYKFVEQNEETGAFTITLIYGLAGMVIPILKQLDEKDYTPETIPGSNAKKYTIHPNSFFVFGCRLVKKTEMPEIPRKETSETTDKEAKPATAEDIPSYPFDPNCDAIYRGFKIPMNFPIPKDKGLLTAHYRVPVMHAVMRDGTMEEMEKLELPKTYYETKV